MKENYTELTAHKLPLPSEKVKRRRGDAAAASVPDLNLVISIEYAKILQVGNKTPVTKIRFIDGKWQQIDIDEAGMRVFFTNKPELHHERCIITQIIPSRSGCYAELMS